MSCHSEHSEGFNFLFQHENSIHKNYEFSCSEEKFCVKNSHKNTLSFRKIRRIPH